MSLVSQITALATRIASEFIAVRSEIAALPAGNFETGTSFPENASVGQTFFATNVKTAYIYDGENWLPMTPITVADGGDANALATALVDGGDA
jgi:hypothetical protein